MDFERLGRQIDFVLEIDKLKKVFRRTYLTDTSRFENSAEHSWHIAVMAVLLSEYAENSNTELFRTVKMLLIHDLVEIDAGDTFAYDEEAKAGKKEREKAAAERIFSLLPADQASSFRELWDEFEARRTPEAKFAAALDRLQPLLHNLYTSGKSWREHGVKKEQVVELNRGMEEGAPKLWEFVRKWIERAVEEGHLETRD